MPTTEAVEKLMKRCQVGVGGRNALDTAHDILAECYGTLGALVQERDRLLRGEWHPTEQDLKCAELAERYHHETEAYDRTVCSGPVVRGSIMPIGPHEMAMVNRNANKVRERIMIEAAAHGIGPQDMARAIARRA